MALRTIEILSEAIVSEVLSGALGLIIVLIDILYFQGNPAG